jgi:hypothetical protein
MKVLREWYSKQGDGYRVIRVRTKDGATPSSFRLQEWDEVKGWQTTLRCEEDSELVVAELARAAIENVDYEREVGILRKELLNLRRVQADEWEDEINELAVADLLGIDTPDWEWEDV